MLTICKQMSVGTPLFRLKSGRITYYILGKLGYTDMAKDYTSSLNLPKTAFAMRAGLPAREPEMLKRWEELDIYNDSLIDDVVRALSAEEYVANVIKAKSYVWEEN